MTEWLDIETAPKDGTRILVRFDERKAYRVDVAHWVVPISKRSKGYWCSLAVECTMGPRYMRLNQPTLWMPLPA